MNPSVEEKWGIAYFEDEFDVPEGTANNPPGHYFYEKQVNKENDFQSSRFFPHGFPVKAIGPAPGNVPPRIVRDYQEIFPNLNPDIILFVSIDNSVNLDEDRPMAAYLHRVITHGNDAPPTGRGLKKFNQGRDYRYNRDFDDIGILELD
jgi:hypothetical protein